MEKQRIHFAHTSDGVSIAYCSMGLGMPLLAISGWMSHLELDLETPYGEAFVEGLSDGGRRRLIRFDMRGSGLSDRNVKDISVPARVRDIEAVVDHLGLDRVAIFAWSMLIGKFILVSLAGKTDDTYRLLYHKRPTPACRKQDPRGITRASQLPGPDVPRQHAAAVLRHGQATGEPEEAHWQ